MDSLLKSRLEMPPKHHNQLGWPPWALVRATSTYSQEEAHARGPTTAPAAHSSLTALVGATCLSLLKLPEPLRSRVTTGKSKASVGKEGSWGCDSGRPLVWHV